MNSRDATLDVLRILACFMVVLMHSPLPSVNANGPFLNLINYATAPCIGLFFMVSGALLLPIKLDTFRFLSRRFSKIVIPTILWSLIYLLLNSFQESTGTNLMKQLASIPFSAQGSGVLWFMYTLAGLYLLAPILSPWLKCASQKELQLVLALWVVTLCYPLLNFGLIINTSTAGILYYFTGYAGYFIMGYYLYHYPRSVSLIICWTITIIGLLLLLIFKLNGIDFDFFSIFCYGSIFCASFACAIWNTVIILCKHLIPSPLLGGVSNCCFGIYLIHILIMRHWLWHQEWIINIPNYAIQCLVIASLTMALSSIACYLFSKIPGSQWIIGYHSRKQK